MVQVLWESDFNENDPMAIKSNRNGINVEQIQMNIATKLKSLKITACSTGSSTIDSIGLEVQIVVDCSFISISWITISSINRRSNDGNATLNCDKTHEISLCNRECGCNPWNLYWKKQKKLHSFGSLPSLF